MSVTVIDVAKKAGVSVGTVSRYLNGYKLREANRKVIESAIQELGFRKSMLGTALRKQRSMTVGVIIGSLTDIYATSIVKALEAELWRRKYGIILCDCEADTQKQRQKLTFLKERQVDGLVLFPFGWEGCVPEFRALKDEGTPLVLVDGEMPGLTLDRVSVDNKNASFRATEKFIHLGHTDIAIITGQENESNARERLRGYTDALQTYGLPLRPEWIKHGDYTYGSGYRAALELLRRRARPSALFVANYGMTIGAMMAVNELNVNIPEDLSFIGFDHFEMFDIIKPPLTVIEQPTDKLGKAAAQLLLKRLAGDWGGFPEKREINTRMLIRGSLRQLGTVA